MSPASEEPGTDCRLGVSGVLRVSAATCFDGLPGIGGGGSIEFWAVTGCPCRLGLALATRGVAFEVGSADPTLARFFGVACKRELPRRFCLSGLPAEALEGATETGLGGLAREDPASFLDGAKTALLLPASRLACRSRALMLSSLCARLPCVILSSARTASAADVVALCRSSSSAAASTPEGRDCRWGRGSAGAGAATREVRLAGRPLEMREEGRTGVAEDLRDMLIDVLDRGLAGVVEGGL